MQRSERAMPKYQVIVDALRARITTGALPAGTQLPTKAALMTEFGVAVNTVERALTALREQGLIESFQGSGTFVRAATENVAPTIESLAAQVADLSTRVEALEQQRTIAIDQG
ncbi:winged helix-turn-helix domain-containing protein [Aldersonia sp. NBC_00410]|uniref:GntR family transcriptional regulator n=1 Tax=Aldersonia sp. NBC_00410 TaxID=2975954 RepID=UPI00225BFA5E|nr:winged helix-turn-helix domain-containing protein [Aldersonia sp. NBC_00410]MCX5046679.1 winged helix-turn-helix domain-containing protein [Aldersonia sp. NBC_00410]